MATREIKTTLVLDGEAKYKQSLQSVDREMRTLSSELGAVTSQYGKNENGMAKCKAIGENLAKQIDQQIIKLNSLKGAVSDSEAAYDKAVKAYDEAAEAFGKNSTEAQLAAKAVDKAEKSLDGYRIQCNNAEKKLNELNTAQKQNDEAAKKLTTDFGKLAKQAAEVATACGKAAAKAAQLGASAVTGSIKAGTKALTAYSTAALTAGTAVVKLAMSSALAADDINTLATQTGLSTEQIQKFTYASNLIDVDIDTLTGSMAKLIKNMNTATSGTGDACEAFEALGISITDDVTGELRNNQIVFDEAIAALSGIENETQRDAYAMAIFGKSAQDLNPLIMGGADALQELGQSAEDAGLILSQESLNHMNALNDSVDILKANTSAAGKVLSETFVDDIKTVTDAIGSSVPVIGKQFAALFSGDNTEEAEEAFRNSISDLATTIGNTVNAKLPVFLNAFNAIMAAVIEQIPGSVASMLPVMIDGLTDLVSRLVDAIPEVLPVVADGALTLFGGILDGLNETVDMLVPMVPDMIDQIALALVDGIPKIVDGGFRLLTGFVEGIGKALPKVVEKASETIPKLVKTITESLPKLVAAAVKVITELSKELAKQIPTIVKSIAKVVPAIVDMLIDSIPDLFDGAVEFLSAIVDALPEIVESLVKDIPGMVTKLVKSLVEQIPRLIAGAVQLFSGLLEAQGEIVIELAKAMPEIVVAVVKGLTDGVDDVLSAAGEMFFGIIDYGEQARQKIEENTAAITPFITAMQEASPQIADFNGLLSDYGNTLGDIDTMIDETEEKITTVLKEALEEQKGLRASDLLDLGVYIAQLQQYELEKLNIYRSQGLAELNKLKLESGDLTQEEAAQRLANSQAALDAANESSESAYTSTLTIIENKYRALGQVGSDAYLAEQEAAKASYQQQLAENEQYYNDAIAIVSAASNQWISIDKEKYSQIAAFAEQYSNQTTDWFHNMSMDAYDYGHFFDGIKDEYSEALSTLDVDSANAFLSMATAAKEGGEDLTEETKQTASDMLACFDNLPAGFDEIGKQALLGMISGIDEYIPELTNASEMTADEIVDTIRTALDIHSPSKVMEEIGEYTILGLISGMNNQLTEAIGAARTIGESLAEAITGSFDTQLSEFSTTVGIAIPDRFSTMANASASSGGSTVSTTTNSKSSNLTINNNSPKAMTQYEQMQQARKAAQLLATWG